MSSLPQIATCCTPAEAEPCLACAVDDIASDPADWPAWTDGFTLELGGDLEPALDTAPSAEEIEALALMTLPELIDHFAATAEEIPSDACKLIAEELRSLAFRVRLVNAVTPAEYRDRADTLEADVREQYYLDGFKAGQAAVRRVTFEIGHDA